MKMVTATDVQNNFGKYLQYAMEQGEVIILRNGKRVARLISEEATVGYLTDSLRGVLKQQYSDDDVKAARTAKYDL
ncbi:MAG: type II toxin-antitoxin system Phd/YefM family antitoxin [Clostridia bacterium]|nr:type II toxin-antitoxin system Phd/YefM family antitoxin [Clostridia bacterium]